MSMLYGWALSSWYGIDHTYVTSSDGHVWNCWGRSSGGSVICRGEGSPRQADCISQRKSHAGLIYGITGVCHQTANRILYPAECLVSGAKNYWVTVFLYGTYGLPPSPSIITKAKLCSLQPGMAATEKREAAYHQAERTYVKKILSLYTDTRRSGYKSDSLPGLELKLTIDYRLGDEATDRVNDLFISHRFELLKAKNELDWSFLARRLTPERYAAKINDYMQQALQDIAQSAGKSVFEKFFGLAPGTEVAVIDPEIMYNSLNN